MLLSLFKNACTLWLYCESWQVCERVLAIDFTGLKELVARIYFPVRLIHFSFFGLRYFTPRFSCEWGCIFEFYENFDWRHPIWSVNFAVDRRLLNEVDTHRVLRCEQNVEILECRHDLRQRILQQLDVFVDTRKDLIGVLAIKLAGHVILHLLQVIKHFP